MDSPNSTANISTGMNAGSGVGVSIPISRPAQPPCSTSATTPYAAASESRFSTAALIATARLRNDGEQQQERQPDHAADQQRQPRGHVLVGVHRGRGHPADVDAGAGDLVAQGADQPLGVRRLRAGRRHHGHHRGVAGRRGLRRGHRRHARRGRDLGPATCASAAPSSSETSSSGPFAPGPKPSASMSYACRVVVPARSLPASGKP